MRRYLLLAVITIFCVSIASAQKSSPRLVIAGGRSFNGSGDLPGYAFLNQVDFSLSRRFFVSPGFFYTNHIFTEDVSQPVFKGSVSGINVFTNLNLVLLSKKRHELSVGAGPVLRFQQSTVPSSYGTQLGNNNQQEIILEYNDPTRSITIGGNICPAYFFHINDRFSVGARVIGQLDSNADMIWSQMIALGIHF